VSSDADLIREINEAVATGDIQAISERMHPDVVWEHNIGAGTPEEGVYRGRANVAELLERIIEPWEYMRALPLEIQEVAPSTYQVQGELHAKHRTSAVEIVTRYEQELEIKDELLVKGRMVASQVSG
jgi:ketosteroid isomerase-like protein